MFKLIYKKVGISSFKAINEFARENNIKKIGHTGTLDPLACGLLLVATDDDTKLIQYIKNKDKEYKVELILGKISKTYDSEGPIINLSSYVPTLEEVKQTLLSFVGNIKQKPPIFSAKKINGKKAYEFARENVEVELKEIDITIFEIKDIIYKYPSVSFTTRVSNGTYIRSLVNDIGNKLKTGAYMSYLERTMVNSLTKDDQIILNNLFDLSNSIKINSIEELKKWFNGLYKQYNLKDNQYFLIYKDNIVGSIKIKNSIIINTNIFGNKITKIINENSR